METIIHNNTRIFHPLLYPIFVTDISRFSAIYSLSTYSHFFLLPPRPLPTGAGSSALRFWPRPLPLPTAGASSGSAFAPFLTPRPAGLATPCFPPRPRPFGLDASFLRAGFLALGPSPLSSSLPFLFVASLSLSVSIQHFQISMMRIFKDTAIKLHE